MLKKPIRKVLIAVKLVLEIIIQDVYGNDVIDEDDENVRTFILLSTEHYF